MLDSTKLKIEKIINEYIDICPLEYRNFLNGLAIKRESLNNKYAEVKGMDFVERQIFEIPETLYNFFKAQLSDTEYETLYSKPGAIWFAKNFKQFRVGEKV